MVDIKKIYLYNEDYIFYNIGCADTNVRNVQQPLNRKKCK